MFCPQCHHQETKVVDSRISENGYEIKRRRICVSCDYRFTTYETRQISGVYVRKRDGSRELYDAEKLRKALLMAFGKRDVGEQMVEEIVHRIETLLAGQHVVDTTAIGAHVLELLKEYDALAYVRFASVYNTFESIEEFYAFFFSGEDALLDTTEL